MNPLRTVWALLLSDTFKKNISLEKPSIPPCIIKRHRISLWFPSICTTDNGPRTEYCLRCITLLGLVCPTTLSNDCLILLLCSTSPCMALNLNITACWPEIEILPMMFTEMNIIKIKCYQVKGFRQCTDVQACPDFLP